jgi:hypothetical protein
MGYCYLLWYVNFGMVTAQFDFPNPPDVVKKALSTAVIWYGIADLVYCLIAYVLDSIAVGAFARRGFRSTLMLGYSLRSWKLTGFLLTCAGIGFFIFTSQAWLASAVVFGIGLIAAFMAAVFLGSAVLELAHKVKVSAWMFLAFTATEFLALGLTAWITVMLFAAAPKWPI